MTSTDTLFPNKVTLTDMGGRGSDFNIALSETVQSIILGKNCFLQSKAHFLFVSVTTLSTESGTDKEVWEIFF